MLQAAESYQDLWAKFRGQVPARSAAVPSALAAPLDLPDYAMAIQLEQAFQLFAHAWVWYRSPLLEEHILYD